MKKILTASICALISCTSLCEIRKGGVAAFSMMKIKDETSKYTAADYVQDGLVAMFDGIENAGFGSHDNSIMSWHDLTGNNFDLTANTDMDFITWGDSFAMSNPNMGLIGKGDYLFTHRNITIEIISDAIIQGNNIAIMGINITDAQNSGIIGIRNAINTIFFSYWDYQPFVSYAFRETSLWYTFVFDQSGPLKVYHAGSLFLQSSLPNFDIVVPNGNQISICSLSQTTTTHKPGLVGKFYAIRIYERQLSAAEITYNATIDKARFGL